MPRAREYLSLPFVSFVVYRRLLTGREQIDKWVIEEENSDEVCLLRKSGQSFIVAAGHFARHAIIALYLRRTTPGPLLASVGPLPDIRWRPSTIRIRVQYGQLLQGIRHVRPDADLVFAGANGAGRKLLGHFRTAGATAIVTADAFWDSESSGSVVRPFTGHRSHAFATGATTLGRLVQCPVIPCVPYFKEDDGALVFKWGKLIPPPEIARNKEAGIEKPMQLWTFLNRGRSEAYPVCFIHRRLTVLEYGTERWKILWNFLSKEYLLRMAGQGFFSLNFQSGDDCGGFFRVPASGRAYSRTAKSREGGFD